MNEKANSKQVRKVSTKVGVRFIGESPLPPVYANAVSVALSIYDLKLTLGVVQVPQVGEAPPEQAIAKPAVEVLMSPQMAKALMLLLQDKVGAYEKTFGQLPDVGKALTT